MQIRVFSSTAAGPTPLAAFDRALQVGGTHDTNLIVLSSVIPAGATVERAIATPGEFRVGDRLFCVMAEQRVSEPGEGRWTSRGQKQRTQQSKFQVEGKKPPSSFDSGIENLARTKRPTP